MSFLSESQQPLAANPTFAPAQIVCLQQATGCLYAEVVQLVEQRQVCWVRPLLLTAVAPGGSSVAAPLEGCDLRGGSDLVLPTVLFRPAFDTEVLPLLMLYAEAPPAGGRGNGRAQRLLSQFVRQLCQSQPEVFQKP